MASGDKYTIEEDTLVNIGDAIREMTDSQEGITPENMPTAIRSIETGSDVSITPAYNSGIKLADYTIDSTSGAIYTPTLNLDDLGDVTISNNTKQQDQVICYNNGTWINSFPILRKEIYMEDYSTGVIDGNIEN